MLTACKTQEHEENNFELCESIICKDVRSIIFKKQVSLQYSKLNIIVIWLLYLFEHNANGSNQNLFFGAILSEKVVNELMF